MGNMRTVSVSQLKTSLSAHLRQVKAGEEIVITRRGRPIARLLPLANAAAVSEHVRHLEAQGLIKRGQNPLPANFWDLRRPADPRGALRAAVAREREENR